MKIEVDGNTIEFTKEETDEIKRQFHIKLARCNFYHYCRLMNPKFFKKHRKYLKRLCDALQEFIFSDKKCLIISLPPRHGKSYVLTLLSDWILGVNSSLKIFSICYDFDLSSNFSRQVRDRIQDETNPFSTFTHNEIFPECKIKRGDGAYDTWSLEGNTQKNYMSARVYGNVNGKGADIIICDDTIRDAAEAYNNARVEKINEWMDEVLMTRREGLKKVIVCMTRYRDNDLAGSATRWFDEEEIERVVFQAYDEKTNTMLDDEILPLKEYKRMMKKPTDVKIANYQQICKKIIGGLYSDGFGEIDFHEYEKMKNDIVRRECYVDVADRGKDNLCALVYDIIKTVHGNEAVIVDVLYTKEDTSKTEKMLAKMLFENNVNKCWIEGNNGGTIFKRNVENVLLNVYKSNKCVLKDFHQKHNKESRILSQSGWCQEHIRFMTGWNYKHQTFFEDLYNYNKEGGNEHDDAQDALTGVAEMVQGSGKIAGFVNIK